MTFTQAISRITPPSPQAAQAALDRMDRMGQDSRGSLGILEEYPPLLAGCTREPRLLLDQRTLVVTASPELGRPDPGQTLESAAARQGALGIALARTGCGVLGVDLTPGASPIPGVLRRPFSWEEGQMSRSRLAPALDQGAALGEMLWQRGTRLVILSTASPAPDRVTALAARLTRRSPARLAAGARADLALALLEKKPSRRFYSLLGALGTPDMAFLAGVMAGCAARQLPVFPDGGDALGAAALVGLLCPSFLTCCFCLDQGSDPAAQALVEFLKGRPLTCAGIQLGCGYGTLTALPLLDGLTHLYHSLAPSSCPYPQRPANVFH